MRRTLLTAAAAVLTLCSCEERQKPRSTGEPWTVTVVCTDSLWHGTWGDSLQTWLRKPVRELPQEEPAFSVRHSKTLDRYSRYAHSLILLSDNGLRQTEKGLVVARDVDARPQMVLTIDARQMPAGHSLGDTLARMLDEFEKRRELEKVMTHMASQAADTVAKRLDVRMPVPAGMKVMKAAKDFVWLSDEGTAVVRNICIYRHAWADGMTEAAFCQTRDSVMRQHLHGETDRMVMTTRRKGLTSEMPETGVWRTAGLWEMYGDGMGGPFVAYTKRAADMKSMVTVEAFVYAPGKPKSVVMWQLEVVLEKTN